MKKTGAVLLAAGEPARGGQFKPLQPYGGSTVARVLVSLMQRLGLDPIAVVTGHKSEQLTEHLFFTGVRFLKTERYRSAEMLDSVRLGIGAIVDECERVLILPMDMPALQDETCRELLRVDAAVVRSVFRGRPKHPILLSAGAARQICAYRGGGGIRGAVESLGLPVAEVEVEDRGVCRDLDTPEEHRILLGRCLRREEGCGAYPQVRVRLCAGEPFFGPGSSELLEGIDQRGSLQEACERMGISYSKGRKLLGAAERQLGIPITQRRAGGPGGGASRLTEAGHGFLRRYQKMEAEVQRFAEKCYRKYFLDMQPEADEEG